MTSSEGRIRLSEVDGPSATEFLGDDEEEDEHQALGPGGELPMEHTSKANNHPTSHSRPPINGGMPPT